MKSECEGFRRQLTFKNLGNFAWISFLHAKIARAEVEAKHGLMYPKFLPQRLKPLASAALPQA
jgi:hypothetical protein